MDGLGIPTVELAVRHELDKCKTETRQKFINKDGGGALEGSGSKKGSKTPVGEPVNLKLNPMEKAEDRRTQRYLLFANKEWFVQWAEITSGIFSGPSTVLQCQCVTL